MLVELSVVEQRYHAVLEVLQARLPVVEVAERYGVSRKSVHAWVRRYQQCGLAGLADRSHRPDHQPRQVPAEVEAAICQMRTAHPKWGPRRIEFELGRTGCPAPVPSRSTVYRVLVRNHFVTARPRKRRRQDYKRWERPAPMQLWQLDIVDGVLADGREYKLVSGVDDHSRFCVIATVVARAPAGRGAPRSPGRCSSTAFRSKCSPIFKLGGALWVFGSSGRRCEDLEVRHPLVVVATPIGAVEFLSDVKSS